MYGTKAGSTDLDENLYPSNEAKIEPSSPLQTKALEFRTPESGKKRRSSMFPHAGLEMQKTPEAELDSPSSVLNPPPSLKRRTIRDYFISSS